MDKGDQANDFAANAGQHHANKLMQGMRLAGPSCHIAFVGAHDECKVQNRAKRCERQ